MPSLLFVSWIAAHKQKLNEIAEITSGESSNLRLPDAYNLNSNYIPMLLIRTDWNVLKRIKLKPETESGFKIPKWMPNGTQIFPLPFHVGTIRNLTLSFLRPLTDIHLRVISYFTNNCGWFTVKVQDQAKENGNVNKTKQRERMQYSQSHRSR